MEQLPVLSHVVVVSHSGGKVPETNAKTLPNGGEESTFANALAAQISAQDAKNLANVVDTPPAAQAPADASAVDLASAASAEQAPQTLADALAASSVVPVPIAALPIATNKAALALSSEPEDNTRGVSVTPDVAPLLNAKATLATPVSADPLPVTAAKVEAEPAIIAATDKALSSKPVIELDAKQAPLAPTQMPTPARTETAATNLAPASATPLTVDIKVGTPGWDTAFSQRVAWAATNQHQVVELRLNPPNLGPVEIRITVNNDQTTAMFVSAHASVRDSIESALPRLREMLAESGLTLGNVNVSSQSFQQQQQAAQNEEQSKSQQKGAPLDLALDAARPLQNVNLLRAHNGLVDTFA